jgi:hypothetical protein
LYVCFGANANIGWFSLFMVRPFRPRQPALGSNVKEMGSDIGWSWKKSQMLNYDNVL